MVVLTGFTDEVSDSIELQIGACRELGWSWIDLRTVDGYNIVDLPDNEFQRLTTHLDRMGIRVTSFGSRIANWERTPAEPFDRDLEDLERAIPRMRRLAVRFLRVMSYRPPEHESKETEREIIRRLRRLAQRAEDAGIVLTHENCETWGGQSYQHTLRLLEEVDSPAFRLVFDTGNPPATLDRRQGAPEDGYQDALEFYRQVREKVVHVHIKDAYVDNDSVIYTWPGEGAGRVPEILTELAAGGYDGPVSIEPHMAVVYHDPRVHAGDDERRRVFVEYAHRTATLLEHAGLMTGT